MQPQIKQIIEKRQGFSRSISEVKFNVYVKEICKIVGLTDKVEGAKINKTTKRKETGISPKYELVTSHICHRSFAANLYGKPGNLTIMGITDHTTEKFAANERWHI